MSLNKIVIFVCITVSNTVKSKNNMEINLLCIFVTVLTIIRNTNIRSIAKIA